MKNTSARNRAFTLIEMLVVISIIGILAALLLPAAGAIKRKAILGRAKAQMVQLQTAIEAYKQKTGFYPPDNSTNYPALNQLYYELLGTRINSAGNFETLDGTAAISQGNVSVAFPGGVQGFMNFSGVNPNDPNRSDNDVPSSNFLKGVKGYQAQWITNSGVGIKVFVGPVPWPDSSQNQPGPLSAISPTVNPWRYISSSPTNNVEYNLWIDMVIAGKTNRVCNWSAQPTIVSSPRISN
jgi:prepilin-type N-terminal cleavage/methylation domain-containing protein